MSERSKHELMESLDRARQTLNEALELENMPEECSREVQDALDSVERTLDLIR